MLTRSDIIGTGDIVQLKTLFRDENGVPKNLAALPTIQITSPDSYIYLSTTSNGVYNVATGTYAYDLTVPITGPVGVWIDSWNGLLGADGYTDVLSGTFNFIVSNVGLGQPHLPDGYEQLGDEPNGVLSQKAIHNLNQLIHILRRRLQSSGWHMIKDEHGNLVRENCDIFSVDELFTFLCSSLSEFNSTPHFTGFTWEDQTILDFRDVIVEGAYIIALASKALIEVGREFTISDNGLNFQPPPVSAMLNGQFSTLLGPYRLKLAEIKHNCKPSPLGLGTLRLTAVSPSVLRLRHRREMQFPIQ